MPLIKTSALLITHADFAAVSAQDASDTSNPASSSGPATNVYAGTLPDGAGSSGSDGGSFAWGVLQQLKLELKGCGDVAKLLEGAALLAQLACIPDCSASALQTVMVMLVNRYPKVCSGTAYHLVYQFDVEADSLASFQWVCRHIGSLCLMTCMKCMSCDRLAFVARLA